MQGLEHIRVIDVSSVLAGPYCAMMLGDLGADVIKVEQPGSGDSSRGQTGDGWQTAGFFAVNRNKRSVTLDLHHQAAASIFQRLAERSDVVIESFRPGTAERFGIGYSALRRRNPRLVYASISGYGSNGPLSGHGGYDIMAQALSGIMSVTGEQDGRPVKAGVAITDVGAGLYCLAGVLAALAAREHTGTGQRVETSLFEAGLGFSIWEATELWWSGETPGRHGSAHRMSAPYQAVRASDGHVTIAALSERQWEAATAVLGHPEWATDERFATNASRMEHRDELIGLIEAVTTTAPAAEWAERLNAAGVPSTPVLDYAAAFAHPQVAARRMMVTTEHSEAGPIPMIGTPVKLSDAPAPVRLPPPRLGEHTEEVLGWLGVGDEEMAALRRHGAI